MRVGFFTRRRHNGIQLYRHVPGGSRRVGPDSLGLYRSEAEAAQAAQAAPSIAEAQARWEEQQGRAK